MSLDLLDLVGDSKREIKKENKKKLHALLDKYGSVEEIERNGSLKDGFELDFARVDGALDEVLEERRMGYREEKYGDSDDDLELSNVKKSNPLLPDDEEFSLEGLTLSDRQRKAIDKLDMNTQLSVIRALREQQGVEKPKPKKETSETSSSKLDVLREKVDKANREIKVADNEHSRTKSDASIERNNIDSENNDSQSVYSISDKKLIRLMGENLIKTEKAKDYIYLDKYGHITVGIGNMIDNEKKFKSLDWKIDGRDATSEEIDEAYTTFISLQNEKDESGSYKYRNYKAEYFKKYSKLRISKDTMIEAMDEHLREDLYRARGKLKEFDKLPIPMKLIILDFYYNKGSFFNQKGLSQSLKNRNAKSFLQSMKRGMKDRDEWTLGKFKQIPSSFWGK